MREEGIYNAIAQKRQCESRDERAGLRDTRDEIHTALAKHDEHVRERQIGLVHAHQRDESHE